MATSSADPPGFPFPTVDVSGFLGSAAAELREGQLMHSEGFSLFKAMGAIVIGDPKMDIWAKQMNAKAVPSVGEVLDGPAAPEKLTGPQLLAVMDRLVACESAWYSGHQAAQTLCTCMYLLRLDRLKCHPILYTYCASVKATCMQVRTLVLEGQVTQEEDFLPHLMGLPLDDLGPNARSLCVAELSSLEDALLSPSWAQHQSSDEPFKLGCYAVDPGLRHALAGRLQLRRLMLMILGCLHKGGAAQAAAVSELTRAAEVALELVLKTQGLAASSSTDGCCPGFSAEVAQAALPPRPCAAVEIPAVPKALEDTKRLLGQLRHACSLTTSVTSLRQLKAFLQGFAALKPGPLAASAAHVLASKPSAKPKGDPLALSKPSSTIATSHAAFQVSREMVLSDLGLQQQHQQQHHNEDNALPEALAKFTDNAATVLRSWVRISCFNAAYRRRKLRRSVADWAALLEAALSADSSGGPLAEALSESNRSSGRAPPRSSSRLSLACGPLSTWAEAEATQAILGHFWSGFELELYAPCEYCMVYWYLGHLTDVVLARTQRILEAQVPSSPSSNSNNSGKRQQKHRHRKETEEEEEARQEAAVEAFVLEARRAACQGMVHLFAGLRLAGLVSGADEFPFNGEQELFSQRFGFLQYLPCPEALDYGYFAQEMAGRAQMSPTVLFELAEMCFKELVRVSAGLAPSSSEDDPPRAAAVSEAASLRRVAQHNTVALQVARKLLLVPGVKLEVKYEFASHPCFPVIGIKQKQQQKRAAPTS